MDSAFLEKLIEYKVAPEPLVAIQGLLNTHDYERHEELLGDPVAASEWLAGAGLVKDKAPVAEEEFKDLIELRQVLRNILEAQSKGEVDRDAFQDLQLLANKYPAGYDISELGQVTLCLKPVDTTGELIGQLVGIVGIAQELNQWGRLKICAADDCRWAFYDSSKNRGGTWCRMEVCGNRTKNRRYRSKSA
jgi:predicted RNA-binding Zn ribbon-like protein